MILNGTITSRNRSYGCRLGLALVLCSSLSACTERGLDREITEVRQRAVAVSAVPSATSEMRFGGMATSENRPAGSENRASGADFVWRTPEGWTEVAPTSMRQANFQVGDDPRAECFLTVLPGKGGGLESNINRWRSQMGLEPLTSEELLALPRRKLFGNEATFVDMQGAYRGMGDVAEDGFRLLGAILSMPEGTLFVKFTGPDEVVSANREEFHAFCDSLDLGSASGHDHAAHAGDGGVGAPTKADSSSGLAWDAPESWVQDGPRSMRVVSYNLGAKGETECYVTVLAGDAGGIEGNVNRWRDQLGVSPMSPAEIAALPTLTMLGKAAPWMEAYGDFSGMGGEDREGAGILGAICLLEGQAIFLKMVGSETDLRAERDNFIRFCESVRSE